MAFFLRKKGDKKPSLEDRIKPVLTELMEARTWKERLIIVKANRDLLLDLGAETAIVSQTAIEQDPARLKALRELRSVLVSCRKNGVAVTFRRLLPQEHLNPDEEAHVVRRLHAVPENINSPQESRHFIQPLRSSGVTHRFLQRVMGSGGDRSSSADPGMELGYRSFALDALLNELRQPLNPMNLSSRIGILRQALALVSREHDPLLWGMLNLDLSQCLARNPAGNRRIDIESAIEHAERALEVFTLDTYPEQYGGTHSNLGLTYLYREQGDRAENLEKALEHLRKAGQVLSRKRDVRLWAMVETNLATVCVERLKGDRAENLELAIDHASQTLELLSPQYSAEKWANAHGTLGLAYRNRILGDKAENIEQAIDHYQKALTIFDRESFPIQWASTQDNLSIAYVHRLRGDQKENIKKAIAHNQAALQTYTLEDFPEEWAAVQHNLGTLYIDVATADRATNIEKAIEHLNAALKVRTEADHPFAWAMTQNALGNAYAFRIRGEHAANLAAAEGHYRAALTVQTLEQFPAQRCKTCDNLGNLAFMEQDWARAFQAYQQAIEAGDGLLVAAYSEAGRQAEVSKTAEFYSRAAYCLLQADHPNEALVMLERGKTRLLAEALALADLDLKSLPEQQRAPLQAARQALKALEAELHLTPDTPARRDDRTLVDLIRTQRSELNTLVDAIRQDHPDFMPLGLELDDILQLIPTNCALVAPLITAQGSAAFVIPPGVSEVTPAHVVPLSEFKEADLNSLLLGADKQLGWLRAYSDYYATHDLKNWQAAIESLTGHLWQTLIAPIHERLSALNVKRLLLLSSGGLQLLPLHAAWRVDKDKQARTLLDEYEISYAPSTYALAAARHRAAERKGNSALVAGINSYQKLSPLRNARSEANAVAHVLHATPLLDSDATEQAIKVGAPGAAYLHLSCHGSFEWDAPMDSALYLANDEPLRLSEIIGELDLRSARLVTLSACETGISDVSQSPDEYIGLPAGFMRAGAPALVSSLWAVDDRSTALLMERFYRNHIEHNMTYPAALREAQLWLRSVTRQELGDYYKAFLRMSADDAFAGFMELSTERDCKPDDRPYANPFYWAAFTFNGTSE